MVHFGAIYSFSTYYVFYGSKMNQDVPGASMFGRQFMVKFCNYHLSSIEYFVKMVKFKLHWRYKLIPSLTAKAQQFFESLVRFLPTMYG